MAVKLDPLTGEMIPLGGFLKTIGGDIDAYNGLPPGFEIPTTGDFAGTTVSDVGMVGGKMLTRASGSAGRSRVQGPSVERTSNSSYIAQRVRMATRGAMTSSNQGWPAQTDRDFRFGLISDDRQNGAYVEALSNESNPDHDPQDPYDASGTWLVCLRDGVEVRKPVPFYLGADHNRRYAVELLISSGRTAGGGGMELTLGDWDVPDAKARFQSSEYPYDAAVRAFVEWEFVDASGTFDAVIRHLSHTFYWRS